MSLRCCSDFFMDMHASIPPYTLPLLPQVATTPIQMVPIPSQGTYDTSKSSQSTQQLPNQPQDLFPKYQPSKSKSTSQAPNLNGMAAQVHTLFLFQMDWKASIKEQVDKEAAQPGSTLTDTKKRSNRQGTVTNQRWSALPEAFKELYAQMAKILNEENMEIYHDGCKVPYLCVSKPQGKESIHKEVIEYLKRQLGFPVELLTQGYDCIIPLHYRTKKLRNGAVKTENISFGSQSPTQNRQKTQTQYENKDVKIPKPLPPNSSSDSSSTAPSPTDNSTSHYPQNSSVDNTHTSPTQNQLTSEASQGDLLQAGQINHPSSSLRDSHPNTTEDEVDDQMQDL
ncbi:hypothetical protein FGO68_gene12647 [Halteria grandinella]|uniref:Uncharacterized protein n=1 Tax=Halteria grandinella TaxID=5974 RepID=A0A8J8P2F5_HALGN|nr:hypothetical protein FGO68_gene12647 [Halteria grandinella]